MRRTTRGSALSATALRAGTVSVVAARAAIDGLTARHLDVEPPLRKAQLAREALASIHNRLPHERVMRLWEAAAKTANDPAFGVHVAEALPVGAYDVLDYLVEVSATAGEAIGLIAEYSHLVNDRIDARLLVDPGHARFVRRGPVHEPHYDEFTMALLLQRSRAATGADWSPELVAFRHAPTGGLDELRRVFRSPIRFGALETEMRFAPSILRLPHVRPDPRLLEILTRYAGTLRCATPSGGDLVARVSAAIERQLATGMPSLDSTSAAVGIPERTLQRRLASAGVTHSGLVDDVRRGLALKHLGDVGLSVLEIAFLLQFSDATSFYRAFKRWTGEAPARYRARLLEGSPE